MNRNSRLATRWALVMCFALGADFEVGWAESAAPATNPASPVVAAVPPLIPVKAFATIPSLSDPQLSPGGQFVASRVRANGEDLLMIHKLFGKSPGEVPSRLVNLGDGSFNWVDWANDQYVLLSLRYFTRLFGMEVPYDRLLLMERDTLKTSLLGPKKSALSGDQVIFLAKDGSYLLLSIARSIYDWPEVLRVDIPSNKVTRIERSRGGVFHWVANSRGEVVAGMARSGRSAIRILYRENPTKRFETVMRLKLTGDDDSAEESFLARINADTQIGYVVSRRGGDRWGLYEYDFKSKAFGATVFTDEKVDLDDYGFDRAGNLRWVSFVDDRWRVKWFQGAEREFFEALEKAVPDKITEVVSTSDSGDIKVVKTSSPTDPGSYYVYRQDTGRMNRIGSVNDALESKHLAPVEYVSYKARDGIEIRAYLAMPVGRAAAKLPLVVMPHGGPFVRDVWGHDFLAQYLVNRGYIVLQPNFRGSTGYGKKFSEAGDQQFGKAMQDDIDDGVRWLVASGKVDPKRVCIVGWSYGGYAAQVASYRNPEIYRCAVSIAGISDLPALLRYDRRILYGPVYRKWSARIRGEESARTLNAVSPLAQVAAISVPLLIVHGTADDRIPVAQSDQLVDALRAAGKRHDYVRIEGGDHSLWDTQYREQLLFALDRFLASHNPTDVLNSTKDSGSVRVAPAALPAPPPP